jgi:acyl-CoA synthetase (AMP-forming)/AMP-acid ligase II
MSSRSDGEFFDWLDYHAKYNPDVTAAIDLGTDRHWTYWQFNDRATRLALQPIWHRKWRSGLDPRAE